jgi:hypothetical protein
MSSQRVLAHDAANGERAAVSQRVPANGAAHSGKRSRFPSACWHTTPPTAVSAAVSQRVLANDAVNGGKRSRFPGGACWQTVTPKREAQPFPSACWQTTPPTAVSAAFSQGVLAHGDTTAWTTRVGRALPNRGSTRQAQETNDPAQRRAGAPRIRPP